MHLLKAKLFLIGHIMEINTHCLRKCKNRNPTIRVQSGYQVSTILASSGWYGKIVGMPIEILLLYAVTPTNYLHTYIHYHYTHLFLYMWNEAWIINQLGQNCTYKILVWKGTVHPEMNITGALQVYIVHPEMNITGALQVYILENKAKKLTFFLLDIQVHLNKLECRGKVRLFQ